MSDREGVSASGTGCACKIGRNAEKYGIEGLDEELLRRRDDGASLRRLETVVNEMILRATLRRAETDVIGDVSTMYRRLTDDDASAGERTEVREWLTRAGGDPDALLDDFVSYQTVRTHLRECLDVDTNREATLTVEDAKGTVEWARSRSAGIVERTIERLQKTEGFHSGQVEVGHVIRVSCSDCGKSYPIERFLERGGCECDVSD
ncbi:rod-determining factor RdfA [Haloarcula marina]|uniref:rod-determining factor RdfA n=1 Tax=Haloarcula marina TaxID=2961574 RepID=UPI0020B8844A|nr:rod-determining factor RdfA [Halomicroarcula marina]